MNQLIELSFSKYEGIGNDFVLVERSEIEKHSIRDEELIALCARHFGVGADGVLIVGQTGGVFSMEVVNADGSKAEMCGNGLRCAVFYWYRAGRLHDSELDVRTEAGPHRCTLSVQSATQAEVEVAMRPPSLVPSEVPVIAEEAMVEHELDIDGHVARVTAVSMGNPHAVLFGSFDEQLRGFLASRIAAHPAFPRGVNVGFAEPKGPHEFSLRVFERGAGWTLACGTGACAAAVAAVETGRAQRGAPVRMCLPGGDLTVQVAGKGAPVLMRGPARHVFDGVAKWERQPS